MLLFIIRKTPIYVIQASQYFCTQKFTGRLLQDCAERFSHDHVKAIFHILHHPGASSFEIFKGDSSIFYQGSI